MFLNKTLEKNKGLIEVGFQLHQQKLILPDTYVIDMDALKYNATMILEQAQKQEIELYFMLKQVGRNPRIAKELVDLGYKGAVVVDFKEANVMMKHNIPICNVGHLVQPPIAMLQELVDYGCDYFTVFSLDKIKAINECAKKSHKVQKLLLKVVGKQDMIYSGQTAGIRLEQLSLLLPEIKKLKNIQVDGVTSFPCFLYDEDTRDIQPTPNFQTLLKAKEILLQAGISIKNLNAPSTTSCTTLKKMDGYGIYSAEPGHGLTGTTPLHSKEECIEIPSVIYVSEVSHNFDGKGYCYGGGYYRRSHIENGYVGTKLGMKKHVNIIPPALDSIDYYFEMGEECNVHDSVIMAFRFQIFVTRSNVCLVEGIQRKQPRIIGIYNSLGDEIK